MWWDWLGADETRALLAADNEPAELALRINPLAKVGRRARRPPRGRRARHRRPARRARPPAVRRRARSRRSRAPPSASPAPLDPQPGERILDLCAAPGGKTTHLAALMGDGGEIVAVERHPQRAQALAAQAAAAARDERRVQVADAKEITPEALGGRFDRVLVDPPCSGLGTLRTHPDLRWRVTPESIEALRVEQEAIVAAARGALAPGGRSSTPTCTLSPREELVAGEIVRTLPHRDGTDGFYIAIADGMPERGRARSAPDAGSRGCGRPRCPAATAASTACTATSCARSAPTAASTARSCGCPRRPRPSVQSLWRLDAHRSLSL